MAKKVIKYIKLQLPAGKATPAPPVGPALGPHGIAAPKFVQEFNEASKNLEPGLTIPVVIGLHADKTYTFVMKTPPAAVLIKKALGLESGSSEPNKKKVGKLTQEQLYAIAQKKQVDLSTDDLQVAASVIRGTARSMGVEVEG